jgi:hypothetical protein
MCSITLRPLSLLDGTVYIGAESDSSALPVLPPDAGIGGR